MTVTSSPESTKNKTFVLFREMENAPGGRFVQGSCVNCGKAHYIFSKLMCHSCFGVALCTKIIFLNTHLTSCISCMTFIYHVNVMPHLPYVEHTLGISE